jgi:hypothetical protein
MPDAPVIYAGNPSFVNFEFVDVEGILEEKYRKIGELVLPKPVMPPNSMVETNSPISTKLADSLARLYFTRALEGTCVIGRIYNAFATYSFYEFNGDGHIKDSSRLARINFFVEYARKLGKEKSIDLENGEWVTITLNNWTDVYSVLPRKDFALTISADDGVFFTRSASFWLGSAENIEGKGAYKIRFHKDVNNPTATLFDVRDVSIEWRWVDRLDANALWEYDWQKNSSLQGVIEGILGDATGDIILGASANIYVNFHDGNNYNLIKYLHGWVQQRDK